MLEKLFLKAVQGHFKEGALTVTLPSGASARLGDGSGAPVHVHIRDTGAIRAMFADPNLGVPEMYIAGRLTLEEGDVYDLVELAKRNGGAQLATPLAKLLHRWRRFRESPRLKAINPRRARANVAHHYDLDERLYRLFLDGDMQYSCAYFEHPGVPLEVAQLAKKRLIAAKLCVKPGARVLDIGSGWGGMALYLAQVCDAKVVGITLSEEQLRVSRSRAAALGLSDRVEFRLQDYRLVEENFDNIVSVGMFEHVGLRHYPDYFDAVARLLKPEGVMLLHSMAQRHPEPYNHPFIEKYVFPDGYIPALSEVLPAVEAAGLLVRDTEILSLHYAETTKAWRERFLARREEVLALYDEQFLRMWDFYLAGSEVSFRYDAIHVFHLQLAREQTAVPLTRAYIPDAMARLKEAERAVPDYAALHEISQFARHG
ncbi:cyclopropane-fatty-acyl-phospholipid synthase family protein [Rhodobacteraceae bacterium DSL-40]|uniref:class I SAM-dependent methyltransferase n=1 Tax=Amaricoccus sp. B4 TaxID=3368557 RepID=UPI000DAB938C